MIKLLKKIDRYLLPDQHNFHYAAYVWLVYLGIFFADLYFNHSSNYSLLYAAIGTIIFLIAYFYAYRTASKKIKWNILAILIIGSFMSQLASGASVFFVYAASFCCRLGNAKKAFMGLIFIAIWIILLAWYYKFNSFFYIPAMAFSLMIGGINIYQHNITLKREELILSQQEVRHLARISERERIARDLHDLIGHTFSVITLKAELAGKLIDKDLNKARNEISELENISRDALKQIREVVTGYRSSDLNTELAHAKYVLESNDIHFDYEFENFEMNETINKELAIILKELITNILKHAHASHVFASIKLIKQAIVLQVEDDGKGFSINKKQGFGLKGIQERVAKLSGHFTIQADKQTSLKVSIPLGSVA
jgi:two-component system sensor histidine kinase DesK